MFGKRHFSEARLPFHILCFAFASAAFATSVIAPRFETLVDEAELIFTGQVISQRSEWRNREGQKSIVTLVTLGVQQMHKGRAADTITLQFLGGTVGDVTLDVSEMPRFRNGERVVLFVADNGTAASPVLGFFHGRFSLRTNGGREEVFDSSGQGIEDVHQIGRAKKPRGTVSRLSHEQFASRIRERVFMAGKQP